MIKLQVLGHMSVQNKICSDIFCSDTKNDLTLVEIYAITLNFSLNMCQIKVGIVQVNKSAWKMADIQMLLYALHITDDG